MNHKGIIKGVAEELGETVRKTGAEVKKQIGEGAKVAVTAVVGGSVPPESIVSNQEVERRKKEEKKQIAYWQGVVREQEARSREVATSSGPKEQQTAKEQMPLINPPGEKNRRRFPWQKPVTGKPEIKGFQTG